MSIILILKSHVWYENYMMNVSIIYSNISWNIVLSNIWEVVGLYLEKIMSLHLYRSSILVWRRQWHPTPVLLPGKSHGWRSLVGCSPWVLARLSDLTFAVHFHALEKEMATHSSILTWRISGTGERSGLPCMGSHRVRHDWRDLAAAAAVL